MANANPFYNDMYGVLYQTASNQGLPNPDVIAHLGAAQASQESEYGRRAPGNNYFGIKGQGQRLKTSESINGVLTPTTASFRQYGGMGESAADYINFLTSNPRYQAVLNAKTPEEAIALQGKSGYATDPNYGSSLANIYRNNGTNMPPPNTNGIMNRVDPNQQPITYSPQPILSQDPNAGILERIANAPGMSDALIQAGAGLLGSTGDQTPLATGLSKGLSGFNAGYAQGIDNNKAKAIPIAGGAFTQVTDARGNVTIIPNAQAQQFIRGLVQDKSAAAQQLQTNGIQGRTKSEQEKKLYDQALKDSGGATTPATFDPEVTDKIAQIDKALTDIPSVDKVGGYNIPMLSNAIDQTYGRAASTPDYNTRRSLDTLFKEQTLTFVKKLGTNPSEGDRIFAEKMQASQDDPTERKLEMLKQLRTRLTDLENRRVEAAKMRDSFGSATPVAKPGDVERGDLPPLDKTLSPGETVVNPSTRPPLDSFKK